MKKINLNSFKNCLSRDDMRKIRGGTGEGGGPNGPVITDGCYSIPQCSTGCGSLIIHPMPGPGEPNVRCNYCCVA